MLLQLREATQERGEGEGVGEWKAGRSPAGRVHHLHHQPLPHPAGLLPPELGQQRQWSSVPQLGPPQVLGLPVWPP